MTAAQNAPRAGFGDLLSAMAEGLQWRLLLAWLVAMLLPVAVVAWPLARQLGGLLDHSVRASAWARHVDPLMFGDVGTALAGHAGWLGGVLVLSVLLMVLMTPFLDGMVVGAGRVGRPLGFIALWQNGVLEYGRMFRALLWSLVPYGVVALVAGIGSHVASQHAESAVLQAQADAWASGVHWVVLVVFVLAQAVAESMRAAFIADVSLKSATRALGRGFMQMVRRPLRTLAFYLVVTLIGLAVAGALGVLRIRTTAVGADLWLALLLGQAIVLVMAWMRAARLFALARLAPRG